MELTRGALLGPYEILSPLGKGGMGEVYRARDTRLGRDVAIKILPAELSQNAKLRSRFQREAKAISNLNHPHICALYDVGETSSEGGVQLQYIVMEYLHGETLETRLKKGPLPLREVLMYAEQIADALDKAHRKQILHRDLKPSNIMITGSDARLFDFGLAKLVRPSQPGTSEIDSDRLSQAATPEKSLTTEGSVIGTLEYMSPEQLQGKQVDARTDVFSFGVCLYQMITGRRPFQGNSRASVIAAILEQTPPPATEFQPATPPSLVWLTEKCLAKDPDERIQTAHDVMLEIQRIAEDSRRISPRNVAVFPSRPLPYVVAAVMIVLLVAIVVISNNATKQSKRGVRRFSIALPPAAPIAPGNFEKFTVSPDGTRIAYVSGEHPSRLFLYSVGTAETKALPDTDGARGPFFSPDGQWIGFWTADRGVQKIAVAKGSPIALSGEKDIRGASWGADDKVVFAESVSLLLGIPASGGRAETIAAYPAQASVRWPSFLPGGEQVMYTVCDYGADYDKARLVVQSLKTGITKTVLSGGSYGRYAPPGYILFLRSQTLFAVPFSLEKMEVTGPPVPLLADVESYFGSGLAYFAISGDGSIFYLPRDSTESVRELVWVNRSGSTIPLPAQRRPYEDLRLSPDGKRLVVVIGPRPRLDLWSYDIERNSWTRLTTDATNLTPVWSPDGNQIAFSSNRNGGFDLYIMPSDGSQPPKQITARRSWDFPRSWSPDGKVLTLMEQYRATLRDIYVVSPSKASTPTALLSTPANEDQAVFSPDGRWIAYQSNRSGRDDIYVQGYPQPGRTWLVSTDGGTNPVWRRDGAELFYRRDNQMMAVEVHPGHDFRAGKPRELFKGEFENEYDVTADGQRFLMIKRPPQAPRTQINVVLGALEFKSNESQSAP